MISLQIIDANRPDILRSKDNLQGNLKYLNIEKENLESEEKLWRLKTIVRFKYLQFLVWNNT